MTTTTYYIANATTDNGREVECTFRLNNDSDIFQAVEDSIRSWIESQGWQLGCVIRLRNSDSTAANLFSLLVSDDDDSIVIETEEEEELMLCERRIDELTTANEALRAQVFAMREETTASEALSKENRALREHNQRLLKANETLRQRIPDSRDVEELCHEAQQFLAILADVQAAYPYEFQSLMNTGLGQRLDSARRSIVELIRR